MYQFNAVYSGEDSAVKTPELDQIEKVREKNSELQIRGAEKQLEQSLKAKERMLDKMEVEPVVVANDILMNRQALELEKYKNDSAAILQRSKGRPNSADELELAAKQNNLKMFQAQLGAQAKMADYILNTLKNDTRRYYDNDYGMERYRLWLIDPIKNPLDATALKVKPQDIAKLLEKSTFEGDGQDIFEDVVENGKPTGFKQQYHIAKSKEQAQEEMLQTLSSSDDSYVQGIVERFSKQDESKIAPYFENYDGNGDGKVDPADRKYAYENMDVKDNPIVKWYLNEPYYLDRAMKKTKVGTVKDTREKPSTSKSGFSINIGGSDYKYTPSEPIATAKFKEFYPFPKGAIVKIPVQNGRRLDLNSPLVSSEATDLTLTGYSKDKDEFIFLTNDANNPLTYASNTEIAIPSANVIDRLKDLMVMYNGKPTPIKAIIGSQSKESTPAQTVTPTTGSDKWSKYKVK